ncbi:MAG: hypothetical protein CM1200mP18_08880 [Gammaproteobacteria bacterium]|nr:MAG: hypothetical protein CM1200mP18_08880 [Gammaproteobacteria bacterium]
MDEYCGGISANYITNEPMLTRGLELLDMLKEDLDLSRRKIFTNCNGPGSYSTGFWHLNQ